MYNYCANNLLNSKCVAWMDGVSKQGNSIGLELYLPFCQANLNTIACSYFSQASLNYNTTYRDSAIQYYCSKNPDDINCNCTNTIIEANNLVTSYLGPKQCWLSSCTLNSTDDKYILTEDLNTRKNCKIINCSINIGNINLTNDSNATINLINQCKNQSNLTQIVGTNQNDRFEFSQGIFSTILIFILPVLLFIIIIIIINFFIRKQMYNQMLLTSIKKININNIA
jgi:hypothetical protein